MAVAWSDESRFVIHHAGGHVKIRRLLSERLLPQCTAGHTQDGDDGIMLSGRSLGSIWDTWLW